MNSWSRETVRDSCVLAPWRLQGGDGAGQGCRMVQDRAKRCRGGYKIHIASSRITVAWDHFGIQWHCQGFRRMILLWHWYGAYHWSHYSLWRETGSLKTGWRKAKLEIYHVWWCTQRSSHPELFWDENIAYICVTKSTMGTDKSAPDLLAFQESK